MYNLYVKCLFKEKIETKTLVIWSDMAHICNPSYLLGGDQEGSSLRSPKVRPHLNKKAGHGGTHLSSQLCLSRRIVVHASPGRKVRHPT
jgi:hypothetical protein